jgi:transposase
MISVELRQRIVDAYTRGLSGTYEQTAELFGVGRATVNRILALLRRTGGVRGLPRCSLTMRCSVLL